MVVHGPVADAATSMVNDLAAAVSQLSVTPHTVCVPPRSTCSHCGSADADSHRVPALPSTAMAAVLAPTTLDAVAALPCATFVVPHVGAVPPYTWNSHRE